MIKIAINAILLKILKTVAMLCEVGDEKKLLI
jgi:hypothetical protein